MSDFIWGQMMYDSLEPLTDDEVELFFKTLLGLDTGCEIKFKDEAAIEIGVE